MQGFTTFLLAAFLQVAYSQGPPPNFPNECRGPPPGGANVRPFECCKIPELFPEKSFEDCGFEKDSSPDCSKVTCVLKTHDLLGENDKLDSQALEAFLDKWVEQYPEFEAAIAMAKERCMGRSLPGPPHCEANIPMFCISSTIFSECPVWEQTDGCTALKTHLDYCKSFFVK